MCVCCMYVKVTQPGLIGIGLLHPSSSPFIFSSPFHLFPPTFPSSFLHLLLSLLSLTSTPFLLPFSPSLPTLSSFLLHPLSFPPQDVGTNYFQRSAKLVHIVLRGGHVIDIKTTPMISLTSGLVVTNDEFFDQNLVKNLENLFEVSKENIRITNVVREDSRKRSGRQAQVLAEVSVRICVFLAFFFIFLGLSLKY